MASEYGFSREKTFMYAVDDYSTPDKWYGLGCELQYNLIVHFGDDVHHTEYESIVISLVVVFLQVFGITLDRLGYNTWIDNMWLRELFGINHTYPAGENDRHPQELVMDQSFLFYIRIFWDKGPFDLRLLQKLEDSLEKICTEKHIRLILTKMIIIPRSKETMAAKIKANSESHRNLN